MAGAAAEAGLLGAAGAVRPAAPPPGGAGQMDKVVIWLVGGSAAGCEVTVKWTGQGCLQVRGVFVKLRERLGRRTGLLRSCIGLNK